MGFFNKFKNKPDATKAPEGKVEKKEVKKQDKQDNQDKPTSTKVSAGKPLDSARGLRQDKPKEVSKSTGKQGDIKGKTKHAYRVLIKPLVTEKATEFGALGKYVFAVNPKMNKVEVKKAIRTVYNVDPVKINMANFKGKTIRYGRIQGKTKGWKKAVVTLKPGDKIEVYEGV